MLLIPGIWILGTCSDLVIRFVVEAPPVMTFTRKSVPPEPIMLIAVPVRMISVFRLKAKNPISRDISTPVTNAASRPQNQLLA